MSFSLASFSFAVVVLGLVFFLLGLADGDVEEGEGVETSSRIRCDDACQERN